MTQSGPWLPLPNRWMPGQMFLEKTNRWLTLVANFAVIAGIFFLAAEIRQNTQQLQVQSYQNWNAANTAINMTIADPDLSSIVSSGHADSANLSKQTYIAYAMFHLSLLQMAQSANYLYLQGVLDEELWRAEMGRAAGLLSLPGVRQWWNAGGRTQVSPSFARFIESVDPGETIRWNWDEERGFFPSEFSAEYEPPAK